MPATTSSAAKAWSLKNKADATVYETEKLLKEQGSKIDAAKKASAEAAIEKLKADHQRW